MLHSAMVRKDISLPDSKAMKTVLTGYAMRSTGRLNKIRHLNASIVMYSSMIIRKFLFIRASKILNRMPNGTLQRLPVPVSVDAISKDHAIERLKEKWPEIDSMDWDFLEELDPEHDIGALGDHLPFKYVAH